MPSNVTLAIADVSVPTWGEFQAAIAAIEARLTAIELRLDGTPNPPPDPPPPPPPTPTDEMVLDSDLTISTGTFAKSGGVIRSDNRSGITIRDGASCSLASVALQDLGRVTLARKSDMNKLSQQSLWIHKAADGCVVSGCHVFDLVASSQYRYGITICQTNNAHIIGNTVSNKAGAGIWTMTGNERGNVFEDNICTDITGTQMRPNPEPDWPASREQLDGDWSFCGYGFAARSSGNIWRRNIARRCQVGYLLWFQHQGPYVIARGEFDSNLAEDCYYDGLQPWRIGIDDNWTPPAGQSVISNFTARRCQRYGVFNYYVRNLLYENLTVEDCGKAGYFGGDYHELDLSFVNFTARNCGRGFQPSTMTEGVVRMTGGMMEGSDWADVVMQSLYSSGGGASCQPREVVLEGVDLRSPTKIVMYRNNIEGQNHILSDKLTWNGRRVYYREQHADAICPASNPATKTIGCPEAGLTNRQAFEKYGVCVAGEIAPPEAHEEPGIEGLIV